MWGHVTGELYSGMYCIQLDYKLLSTSMPFEHTMDVIYFENFSQLVLSKIHYSFCLSLA